MTSTYLFFSCGLPFLAKFNTLFHLHTLFIFIHFKIYENLHFCTISRIWFCIRPNFKPLFLRNVFFQKCLTGSWKIWDNSGRKYPLKSFWCHFNAEELFFWENVEVSICDTTKQLYQHLWRETASICGVEARVLRGKVFGTLTHKSQ